MPKTFLLKITAIDKEFYNGECEKLIFPASDGKMEILAGHENIVTIVNPGELKFSVGGEWRYASIGHGFAEVRRNTVMMLTDSAEHPEDIDIKRAREEREHAEDMLHQKQSLHEHYAAELALARAIARVKVAGRRKKKYNDDE